VLDLSQVGGAQETVDGAGPTAGDATTDVLGLTLTALAVLYVSLMPSASPVAENAAALENVWAVYCRPDIDCLASVPKCSLPAAGIRRARRPVKC